jgi:Flp pilus assembly protein TadD
MSNNQRPILKAPFIAHRFFWPLVIALAIVAVFGQIVGFDFVWFDDQIHILQNPNLNPLTLDSYMSFWTKQYQQLYIPVSYTIFALLALVSPHLPGKSIASPEGVFNPHVFHAASLLLHIANSLLIYLLLKRWTRKDIPSAISALLFALHPLQVESVAWISEIRGLSATLLGLLATLVYCSRGSEKNTRYWTRYAGATLLFLLAILSKPSAVPFPIMTAVFDRMISKTAWKTIATETSLWLLISVGAVLLTRGVQPVNINSNYSLSQSPIIVANTLLFYLEKLVLPINLCADYGQSPKMAFESPHVLFEMLLAAVLLASWIWTGLKRKEILAAGIVSLALIAPVSGIIPFGFQYFSIYADRYAYAPMIGAAMAASWIACELAARKSVYAVSIAALIILAGASFVQTRVWKDSFTLMNAVISVDPNSTIAHATRAFLYRRKVEQLQSQIETSKDLAEKGRIQDEIGQNIKLSMNEAKLAIDCRPTNSTPYLNLGILYDDIGQTERAIDQLQIATRLSQNDAEAHMRLANCYTEAENYPLAYSQYMQTQKLNPNYPKLHFNMGNLYSQMKNFNAAVAEFNKEIALYPNDAEAHMNEGIAFIQEREPSQAVSQMQKAISIGPARSSWWTNLAIGHDALGDKNALQNDLNQALALNANDPVAISWKKELQKKDMNRK